MDERTIYVAVRWYVAESSDQREQSLDIGMISASRETVQEFCSRQEGYTLVGVRDGQEWPIL